MKPSDTIPKPKPRGKDDQTINEMAKEIGISRCQMEKIALDMVESKKWTRYRSIINGRSVYLYHVN